MDQAQFADQLFALEGLFLTKLTLWAGISVVTGSLVLALIRLKRIASALLERFAHVSLAWGVIEFGIVAWARRGLRLRDLAGAIQLDRFVWFSIGLEAGVVLVGLALAVMGWRLARRLGLVGAGVAIVVQGLALALLHLQLSAAILR